MEARRASPEYQGFVRRWNEGMARIEAEQYAWDRANREALRSVDESET